MNVGVTKNLRDIAEMNEESQLADWESQEELADYQEACRIAQYDLWQNDDGSV